MITTADARSIFPTQTATVWNDHVPIRERQQLSVPGLLGELGLRKARPRYHITCMGTGSPEQVSRHDLLRGNYPFPVTNQAGQCVENRPTDNLPKVILASRTAQEKQEKLALLAYAPNCSPRSSAVVSAGSRVEASARLLGSPTARWVIARVRPRNEYAPERSSGSDASRRGSRFHLQR
jgi:hypothetical protein